MNQIEVQIKLIKYPKVELDNEKRANGETKLYYVMDALQKDNSTLPVVGFLAHRPQLGERFVLSGKFSNYQGLKQFAFDYAEPVLALNFREMLHYAAERTNGIGEVIEAAIWDKYGESWAKEIKPNEVKGLTQEKFDALLLTLTAMETAKDRTKTISWLLSHKLTINFAEKAYEEFGAETINIVSVNCYNLAQVDGYGFITIDNGIRQTFGVDDFSPLRLEAAIIYTMKQLTKRGDTLIDWENLKNEAQNTLKNASVEIISQTVSNLFTKGFLKGFPQIGKIALAAHYKAEKCIFDFITQGEKTQEQEILSLFQSKVF